MDHISNSENTFSLIVAEAVPSVGRTEANNREYNIIEIDIHIILFLTF